jgi:DNA-binding XRE family transcriptional regulator
MLKAGSTTENAPPLAAGQNVSMMDDAMVRAAEAGARIALEEFRQARKMGRDDRGTGDPEVGSLLRNGREWVSMTQTQLAEAAGVHYTTIGKIETGERGMSLSTFCKIGNHLGKDWSFAMIERIANR